MRAADLGVVFEVSPNAYMALDRDLRYVAANAAYCKAVGRACDELLGVRILDLFPHDATRPDNDSARRLAGSFRRVFETGHPDILPVIHYRISVDGRDEDRYWSASHTPLFGADGSVEAVLQHTVDITQLHRRELVDSAAGVLQRAEAVQAVNVELERARRDALAAEAELQAIFDSFPEALFAGDRTGVTRISDRAREMLGYRSIDELKRPIPTIVGELVPRSPETGERIAPEELPFRRALRGLRTRMEVVLARVDTGEDRHVFVSGAPVVVDGVTTGAVVTQIDITEQKRTEAEVAKLARVLDASHDFIGIANTSGMPTFVNAAGLELMGLPDFEAARALPVVEYFIEAERERVQTEVLPAAVRDGYWEGELTFKHARTGEHIPVLYAVFPLRERNGTIGALATITRDLRAHKALLDAERTAREQAEEANRLKDQFLATVSHELRTPLTAILGWMQMLRAGLVSGEKQQRALETVERNARIQAQLIDDLLDVSRIVSGKLALELESVEIAAVVAAAIETVRPAAQAKGVALETIVGATPPLIGDPRRLQQVLWNLLSNGVKFTPAGGSVTLRVERREDRIVITVADTGAGIAPEFLPHVFERFRQADTGASRRAGGLGLGLSIVHHLVAAHGGDVRVHSDGLGRGARFVVNLPGSSPSLRLQGAPVPGAIDPPPALAGRRVLVVDDEADTREYVGALLRSAGVHVATATCATDALSAVAADAFDAIVSDLGMPGADGYALIASVRALPEERGGLTPAIALTAFARADDRMRAMRAGFQNHVTKPVDPAELFAVLLASIATVRSGSVPTAVQDRR